MSKRKQPTHDSEMTPETEGSLQHALKKVIKNPKVSTTAGVVAGAAAATAGSALLESGRSLLDTFTKRASYTKLIGRLGPAAVALIEAPSLAERASAKFDVKAWLSANGLTGGVPLWIRDLGGVDVMAVVLTGAHYETTFLITDDAFGKAIRSNNTMGRSWPTVFPGLKTVNPSGLWCLMGPTGSGKTELLARTAPEVQRHAVHFLEQRMSLENLLC